MFLMLFIPATLMLMKPQSAGLSVLSNTWNTLLFISWLAAIGFAFSKGCTILRSGLLLFKITFLYSLCFILVVLILKYFLSFQPGPIELVSRVIAFFATIYMLYYASRCLIEKEKELGMYGVDFYMTFISFIFFPIGLFYLQPRINKVQRQIKISA